MIIVQQDKAFQSMKKRKNRGFINSDELMRFGFFLSSYLLAVHFVFMIIVILLIY